MRQVTEVPVGVEVGAKVHQALKERKMTLQGLATELVLPYASVQRWCDGSRYEWKLSDLLRIARLLEMEPHELLPRSFLPPNAP